MNSNSHSIVVMASIAVIICAALVISSSPQQTTLNAIGTFPTGQTSPEGAACDLIRAYISRNETLFHESRCKMSCENSFDYANAYKTFLEYKPLELAQQPDKLEIFDRPTQIKKILPAKYFSMSDEEKEMKKINLFFNDGACESKYVDVTTATNTGIQYITRVETVQFGQYIVVGKTKLNKGLTKFIQSGIWKARIIQYPLLKKSS